VKILVVDDDFETRESIKNMLTGQRVNVIYTSDTGSALLKLKDNEDIETVITDYRLPGLSGKDWISILRHFYPNMHIIVISGYDIVENILQNEGLKIIKKPFKQYQLLDAIGL